MRPLLSATAQRRAAAKEKNFLASLRLGDFAFYIRLALLGLVCLTLNASLPATHEGQIIGYSVQNRPIKAYTVGWGRRAIVLVGGLHGGAEWSTTDLVTRAAEYYRLRAADVPPTVSLVFIPSANPDGLALGRTRAARFNARGVDLNRNWDCGWKRTSKWNDTTVSGGAAPFSEPETSALRDFILELKPALVVFYHSQAGTVGTGVCAADLPDSIDIAHRVARATGYVFNDEPFYEVSGESAGYFNQEGIPAIEIELWTHADVDWAINLRGIKAMMEWASEEQTSFGR